MAQRHHIFGPLNPMLLMNSRTTTPTPQNTTQALTNALCNTDTPSIRGPQPRPNPPCKYCMYVTTTKLPQHSPKTSLHILRFAALQDQTSMNAPDPNHSRTQKDTNPRRPPQAKYRYALSTLSRYSLASRSSIRFLIIEISGLNRPASWPMTSVVSWVWESSLRCLRPSQ
jgi:hypothetical protein